MRTLELEEITETVDEFGRATYKLAKAHADDPVVQRLRLQVEGFKAQSELLQELANPALQHRHWSQARRPRFADDATEARDSATDEVLRTGALWVSGGSPLTRPFRDIRRFPSARL